jgi:hypothetical protein
MMHSRRITRCAGRIHKINERGKADMSTIVKMPISNVLLGSDYTGEILVGAEQKKMNVILDTGSSTLAVDGQDFNPASDKDTKTTNIAQEVQYGSGSWVGAVVHTSVGLSDSVSLKKVNLAVTYEESANMFGNAQGIWVSPMRR